MTDGPQPPTRLPTARPSATSTRGAGARPKATRTMRDLLGGKGAGLAEMTNAGLPVPPGFTITTEACNDYFAAGEQLPDGLWDDVLDGRQARSSRRPARASATPRTRCWSASARAPSSRCRA